LNLGVDKVNITHRPAQWKRLRDPIAIPFWLAAILVAWHMVETIHTFRFIVENLKWLTTAWGNVFLIIFGFAWLGLILFGKSKPPADEIRPGSAEVAGEPTIFIAAQSTPVTIRFFDATVSFTIFSCSSLTLTFVELRLGTAIFKEVFQESIEAFNPRFITLSRTLNASEMEQLKQQLKISQTIQLFGTVKFGGLQRNFEFSTVPYLPNQAL
jgi:hypothetical protein